MLGIWLRLCSLGCDWSCDDRQEHKNVVTWDFAGGWREREVWLTGEGGWRRGVVLSQQWLEDLVGDVSFIHRGLEVKKLLEFTKFFGGRFWYSNISSFNLAVEHDLEIQSRMKNVGVEVL